MSPHFVEEQTFEKIDYTVKPLEKGDYELCVFLSCNFSNADLSHVRFVECEFHDCNLSNMNLHQTAFQEVLFNGCKMLGLHFEKCSNFAFSIKVDNCQLNLSTFYQQKLAKTKFIQSKLQDVDFSECDLSASVFDDCDLLNATFLNNDLKNADFRTALNFAIDPENNRLKGAKFSLQTVGGLLSKYNITIES